MVSICRSPKRASRRSIADFCLVLPVYGGRPFRLAAHFDRMARSLAAIRMAPPLTRTEWAEICAQLVTRNGGRDMYLYAQVSRGTEFGRNHAWPDHLKPTIFAYASELTPIAPAILRDGVAAVTARDTRWARRDIKSTALLANVLLKKLSADVDAFETILLENGRLTEGASTAVIVVKDGVIRVPPNGEHILPAITREVLMELAVDCQVPAFAVSISESELRQADEIWLGFSTRGIIPVTRLDGSAVGGGQVGPVFRALHAAFEAHIRQVAGTAAL
jgi:D-alanine transaminase